MFFLFVKYRLIGNDSEYHPTPPPKKPKIQLLELMPRVYIWEHWCKQGPQEHQCLLGVLYLSLCVNHTVSPALTLARIQQHRVSPLGHLYIFSVSLYDKLAILTTGMNVFNIFLD